jgi:RIO kinase 1
MHEFELLTALHRAGADVPKPIDHNEQALLMEFIGEGLHPAPTLSEVTLSRAEAQQLCERVLFNVELLLQLGWVHGDLSAYNILYRHGQIVLIDFPQVASARDNPQARALLERDLERVARYFARAGVALDAQAWARRLWSKREAPGRPPAGGEPFSFL